MKISAIVATVGRPELAACLASLKAQSRAADEIIVVDNSGESAAIRRVAGDAVRVIACAKKGCSAARNAGARVATGDIIAFIDDDAQAHPDWLANIERAFREAPISGMAGGVIFGGEAPTRAAIVVDQATPDWFWLTNFGGIGTGTNLAFRRASFSAHGGFNEKLGPAAAIATNEEHYLFFLLVRNGEKIAYYPRALVSHPIADLRSRKRHLRIQRAAAAYVCFLWDHHPESRPELKKLLRRGKTPLKQNVRAAISPEWARWLYRGLGLADYLKMRA